MLMEGGDAVACSSGAPIRPTLLGHRAPQKVVKCEVVIWICLEASETILLKGVTIRMS